MFSTVGLNKSAFAVGDIANSFQKLSRLLLKINYPTLFARERVLEGETAVFIPMLRYALTSMSHKLSRKLLNQGFEIYATADAKFMECVYKVCIHSFNYYPVLTQLQFLTPPKGYAERKIAFVTAVIQYALNKHQELVKETKNEGVRSTSEKKKQREAVQARLTAAAKQSAELVVEEVIGFEGVPDSGRGSRRRDSSVAPASHSASQRSTSRARSASASRVRVGSMSASRKKSQPNAIRPSTGAAGGAQRLNSSTNRAASTSSASFPQETNDFDASQSYLSTYHNHVNDVNSLPTSALPQHSVSRSTAANGEVLELKPWDLQQQQQQHQTQLNASFHRSRNEGAQSPVKKAWVHEHGIGSRDVSVVGFVRDGPDGNSSALDSSFSRSKATSAEFSRAQDLNKLRAKEALLEEQAEQDRLKLLQLQHQEYAVQNSPHVDFNAQHPQWQPDEDAEIPRDNPFQPARSLSRSPRSSSQQQYSHHQHSHDHHYSTAGPSSQAEEVSMFAASQHSLASPSPSRHVIGDEMGLNSSFSKSRSDVPRLELGTLLNNQNGDSNSGDAFSQINNKLQQIAQRTSKKPSASNSHAASRSRKGKSVVSTGADDSSAVSEQQIPSVQHVRSGFNPSPASSFNGLHATRATLANPRTGAVANGSQLKSEQYPPPVLGSSQYQASSTTDNGAGSASATATGNSVSEFLNSAPRLTTALESKLFSMLENIQAKMIVMESNVAFMEQKLNKFDNNNGLTSAQANFLAHTTHPNQIAQALAQQAEHTLQQNQVPRELAVPSSRHMYHAPPSVTSLGASSSSAAAVSASPPIAALPVGAVATVSGNGVTPMSYSSRMNWNPPLAPHPSHVYNPSTSYFGTSRGANVNQLASGSATPSVPSVSLSRHASPQRASHARAEDAGLTSSPARRSVHQSGGSNHGTPMKIPTHVPHSFNASAADGFGATHSSASHLPPNPRVSSSAAFLSSHNTHPSALHASHSLSGSASQAQENVIPSTDNFIEQLKARLRQTEDLIHTAKLTAKQNESQYGF